MYNEIMSIYIYIHVCVYIHTCIFEYICIYIYSHVCICVCVCVCVCVNVQGGGLYVEVLFEGQILKTCTRYWSENVVLNTSHTLGVTHESRFFDWGEKLTFYLVLS